MTKMHRIFHTKNNVSDSHIKCTYTHRITVMNRNRQKLAISQSHFLLHYHIEVCLLNGHKFLVLCVCTAPYT